MNPHLNHFVRELIIPVFSSISIFTSLLKEKNLLLYNERAPFGRAMPYEKQTGIHVIPFGKTNGKYRDWQVNKALFLDMAGDFY